MATKNFVNYNGESIEKDLNVDNATPGLMDQADKVKLDGIAEGANKTIVDSALNSTSTNSVQNKVINSALSGKASNDVVTTSKAGLSSAADKTKLDGIATNANNYTHPTTHPATIIVEDTGHRFITDAERTAWNAKAPTTLASTTVNGLMSAAMVTKLNGIATGANAYTHPTTHPASIIVQDASNRFVTDAEKTAWNGKAAGTHNHNASNINAGTLGIDRLPTVTVAKGGTGATTAAAARNNLGMNNFGLACSAGSTNGVTTLPELTITKVPLNTFRVNTDSSVFTFSNGGIRCGRAGTILVSGSVYIALPSSDSPIGAYVYKGTAEVTSQYLGTYSSGAVSSGAKIINVAVGDIIYLHARCRKATTYTGNLLSTSLDIAYIV